MKISAVILTKNEEKNIQKALDSVRFCDEIVILDDFSTDGTIPILHRSNVRLIQKPLENDFSRQRNVGIKEAKGEWVLFIDADEVLTDELRNEITEIIMSKPAYEAYYLKRRDYWWGREMKWGETMSARKRGIIRLINKGAKGEWKGKVHETFYTDERIGRLNGFINHFPHKTLKEFIKKVNMYSTLRAKNY